MRITSVKNTVNGSVEEQGREPSPWMGGCVFASLENNYKRINSTFGLAKMIELATSVETSDDRHG